MKRSWTSAIAVCLVIGLLTVFLGLQYRWLFMASDAERERMQKRVEVDATRFAEDFNREMQAAYYNFQTPAESWKASDWREFNERYDYWKSRTAYPELIRDIYYFAKPGEGVPPLRYNVELRTFEPASLSADLAALRAQFADDKGHQVIYEDDLSMILPIYEQDKRVEHIVLKRSPEPRSPMVKLPEKLGWLLIRLDESVIRSRIVPDLEARYFPDKDYKVTILGSGQAEDAAQADASARLFDLSPDNLIFFANREMLPRTGQKQDVVINQRVESRKFAARTRQIDETKGETFKVEVQSPGEGKPRATMFATTTEEPGPWTLSVRHNSGSIDAYVRAERNKSFLIGFGVYVLLVGAIIAIVLSSLRSKRFAQRQIDFVSSVSHEFRTPLAVIYSAGENLADGVAKADNQVARYGELIKGEGKKLSGMVEQILEFAGASSGRRKFNFADVSIRDVVDAALAECRPLTESGGFTIESDVSDNLPKVSADKSALSRALQNLISNSVKYSDGSKWIRVSAKNGDGLIKISVEDKGIGIPGDELRLIFDPFYRAKDVVDAQISGNGLGLNLVKKIVEAHGGRVSAESQPGRGSKFTIELPQK